MGQLPPGDLAVWFAHHLAFTLKVVAFGFFGFAFLPWAPLLLAMIGAGFLGTMLGRRLLDRLPHHVFAVVFKIVLTVLALRLLYAAASAW